MKEKTEKAIENMWVEIQNRLLEGLYQEVLKRGFFEPPDKENE